MAEEARRVTRSTRRTQPEVIDVDDSTEERTNDGSDEPSEDGSSRASPHSRSSSSDADGDASSSSSANTDDLLELAREEVLEGLVGALGEAQHSRNSMLREFHALHDQGARNAGVPIVWDDESTPALEDNAEALHDRPPRITPDRAAVELHWRAGPSTPPVGIDVAVTAVPEVTDLLAQVAAADLVPVSVAEQDPAPATDSDGSERMDVDEDAHASATLEEAEVDAIMQDDDSAEIPSQTPRKAGLPLVAYPDESPEATSPNAAALLRSPAAALRRSRTPAVAMGSVRTPTPLPQSPMTISPAKLSPAVAPTSPPAEPDDEADEELVEEADADAATTAANGTKDDDQGVSPAAIQPPPPERPRVRINFDLLLEANMRKPPSTPHRLISNLPDPLTQHDEPDALELRTGPPASDDSVTLFAPDTEFTQKLPLPPLSALPSTFNMTTKPSKLHRRREKERRESLAAVGGGPVPGPGRDLKASLQPPAQQDYVPQGMNRWAAIIRANPVHKLIKKAPKILLTSDWKLAHDELMFLRAMDRIDKLKQDAMWSFRQPKRQKNPVSVKVHWDYLIDEMRWMRTDFREERKWKLVLAHELAHAVKEWHETDPSERHTLCAKWKPYDYEYEEVEEEEKPPMLGEDITMVVDDVDGDVPVVDMGEPMTVNGWQPPPPGTPDPLGPPSPERQTQIESQQPLTVDGGILGNVDPVAQLGVLDDLAPKSEEMDVDVNVVLNGEPSQQPESKPPQPTDVPEALKRGAENAVLASTSQSNVNTPGTSTVNKLGKYPQSRDAILALEENALWIDLKELQLTSSKPDGATPHNPLPQDISLTDIFPELDLYESLPAPDVTIATSVAELKDKPGDKRVDETYSGRLMNTSRWMDQRPTLVSALNPAEKWRNGKWQELDSSVVYASLTPDDSISKIAVNRSSLFGAPRLPEPMKIMSKSIPPPLPAQVQQRASELYWTAAEDDLLKSLVEKFQNNWRLIAEWFNSARLTIHEPNDLRTPWDLCERWQRLYAPPEEDANKRRMVPEEQRSPSPPKHPEPQLQLLKRTANVPITNGPSEPLKRKRTMQLTSVMAHNKKRRIDTQKQNASNVKRAASANMHETHSKIAKTSFTVQEMVRVKLEKDREENVRAQANGLARLATNPNGATSMITQIAQMGNPHLQAQRALLQQQHKGIAALGNRPLTPQQHLQLQTQMHLTPEMIATYRAHAQVQALQQHQQAQAQAAAANGQLPQGSGIQQTQPGAQVQAMLPAGVNLQNYPPDHVQRLTQQIQRQNALRLQAQVQAAAAQAQAQAQSQTSPPRPGAVPGRPGSATIPQMERSAIQAAQAQAVHAMMQSYSSEEQMRQRVNLQHMIAMPGPSSSPPGQGAPPGQPNGTG